MIKRNKAEIQRSSAHRSIDEIFNRVQEEKQTCSVTLTLAFNTGGLSGSQLLWTSQNVIKVGPAGEEGDYDTRI